MKRRKALLQSAWIQATLILLLLIPVWSAEATRHIITFVCCEYTPSSLQAAVGDTIEWQGAFGEHPLSSTSIPPGAPPFQNSTGTTFSYRIQVVGTYNYHCVFHTPSMAGSFTATGPQYPLRTIRELREVSIDSLRALDTLQLSSDAAWTKQRSRFYRDTVRVRGVVVVPAKVINYTATGFNLLLADTASPTEWGGLFVRPAFATPADTSLAIQWGILGLEAGDYIELTGWMDEFPTNVNERIVSGSQLVPLFSRPLTILGTAPIPPPVPILAGDLYGGIYPSSPPYPPNGIRFSTGKKYHFMRVVLTDLVVTGNVNATNGTFNMVQNGNYVADMDASKWFTLRAFRDPSSTYTVPPAGVGVDLIRGYVMTNSGAEYTRGYRIAPLYPGDLLINPVIRPSVSTHRRNPIVVSSTNAPVVSVRVVRGTLSLGSVQLRYSVNNGPWTNLPMTLASVDTFAATIPQQAADAFVKYYINVADSAGNTVKLASSATDGSQTDTVRGFFFYNVLDRALTIRDVQYTPFLNGRSAYIGARVTLRGLITADTASLVLPPTPFRGTNVWYLQSTNAPWSGIWVHNDSLSAALNAMRNGDSVAITGTVAEHIMDSQTSYVTRLQLLDPPVIYSSNNPLPAPVVLQTGNFGSNNTKGTPSAEQWEGMLVQFNNVTLSDTMPAFQIAEEFGVNDGSGQAVIRKDGRHNYTQLTTEVELGRILIPLGSQISYLRGIIHFSGNRYKIVPRKSDDFGTIVHVQTEYTPAVPSEYTLSQNYPNPFNPVTTIEFSLPTTENVSLKIYNILGQEMETLLSGIQGAGTYKLRFDASKFGSGVYFYRVQAGNFTQTRKMLLLK
jgi:hypothetical protein